MRSWMIAFSAGIFVCGFTPVLPPVYCYFVLILIPVLSFKFCCLRHVGVFSLGLLWFILWAQQGVNNLLPKTLEGESIWLQGRVLSLPQHTDHAQRFTFLVNKSCAQEELMLCDFTALPSVKNKIQLSDYEQLTIVPGQHWQWQVRLKRPHGFVNPGGFDYQGWLTLKRISATGYVRSHQDNKLLAEPHWAFGFNGLRYAFAERVNGFASDQSQQLPLKNSALIKALSIGDRYNITEEEWELLTVTGTNHLVVISGLHVGLVTWMVYRISVYLLSFLTSILLCIPAQRSAAIIAVMAAFFYAGLAGFSLPAQRAFIMLSVLMSGHILARQTSPINSFCLALVLVLILQPLAPHSSGFWLSFGAVGLLLLLASTFSHDGVDKLSVMTKAMLLVRTQVYLLIGLLPLMLFFYQQQSLLAPVVNIVAIPFISFLVVPLCLLGLLTSWYSVTLSYWCLRGADFFIELFILCLQWLTNVASNLAIELPMLTWPGLLLLSGCALAGLICVNKIVKYGALSCIAIFFAWAYYSPSYSPNNSSDHWFDTASVLAEGEFTLTVLDVGQGLAVLVRTRDYNLLYDTGPAFSPRFNAGSGVIIPFLRAQNIQHLDRIMISHGDSDHAGGLPALLKRFPKSFYMAPLLTQFSPAVASDVCRQGQQWQWNSVNFEVLHPDAKGLHGYSSNNSSCVLKISVGEFSALLAGDIERQIERQLIASVKQRLSANILLAPHHGSNTSSIAPFIAAVSPQYTVFSSGYLSRFGHPHPKVSKRYVRQGSRMLTTAKSGAISFKASADHGIELQYQQRYKQKRYWSLL